LIHHTEKAKFLFGVPCVRSFLSETGVGHTTMTLFFVLSGFLITYILLAEKFKTNTIVIKNFYIRRISRIWPIYYIVLLLGITVFTYCKWGQIPSTLSSIKGDYYIVVLLYFFHMSNFQLFFTSSIKSLLHYWSMGVEEQFYAFWPWLVKKTKNYVKIFVIIILIKITVKLLVAVSYRVLPLSAEQIIWLKHVERFLFLLRFEAFASGGIAAYFFVSNKEIILNFLYKPWLQWLNIGLLILSTPLNNITETIHVFYSISFAILILNMAGNPKAIFSLNNKYTDYIGKISYGIYMYQVPILIVLLNLLKPYYTVESSLIWNVILYAFVVFITLFVSAISHEFVEKKIINWAKRKTVAE